MQKNSYFFENSTECFDQRVAKMKGRVILVMDESCRKIREIINKYRILLLQQSSFYARFSIGAHVFWAQRFAL